MGKINIVLAIAAIVSLLIGYLALNQPVYGTVDESTRLMGPGGLIESEDFKIGSQEKLTLDFEWRSGDPTIVIYSSESIFDSQSIYISANKTEDIFQRKNEDSGDIEYHLMASLATDDEFVIYVKVEKDKSLENLLIASIFFLIGIVIFVILLTSFMIKISDRGSKSKVRGLGVIFLFLGCVMVLLFILSIFMALLGIALIFTGVELLMISGRIRSY